MNSPAILFVGLCAISAIIWTVNAVLSRRPQQSPVPMHLTLFDPLSDDEAYDVLHSRQFNLSDAVLVFMVLTNRQCLPQDFEERWYCY